MNNIINKVWDTKLCLVWYFDGICFQTNSCPVCRQQYPTDDERYESMLKHKKRQKEREQDIENLHNSMFG